MAKKQESIADARANLAELVREAEAGSAVELTRRGRSVAVLVSTGEYERLIAHRKRFSTAWDAFREQVDLTALGIEPDEVFADVRSDSPGRDPELDR